MCMCVCVRVCVCKVYYLSTKNSSSSLKNISHFYITISLLTSQEEEIFVKVHYTSTRALVVDRHITLKDLEETVCKKFERPIGTVSLW